MYNSFCFSIIFVGAVIALWQVNVLKNKEIVYGTVIDTPSREDSEGSTTYGIVANFKVNGDASYEYRSKWFSSSGRRQIGEKIKLYFDKENPSICGICSFHTRFGVAFIIIFAGLVLMAGKYGLTFGEQVMNYVYPVTRVG